MSVFKCSDEQKKLCLSYGLFNTSSNFILQILSETGIINFFLHIFLLPNI